MVLPTFDNVNFDEACFDIECLIPPTTNIPDTITVITTETFKPVITSSERTKPSISRIERTKSSVTTSERTKSSSTKLRRTKSSVSHSE